MTERVLVGVPASPGSAIGRVWRLGGPEETGATLPAAERPAEAARALASLEAAARELEELSESLRREHRDAEAGIVETGGLMARDPALAAAVEAAVRQEGRPPAAALVEASESFALAIAAVDDELLAARAADVRSLGARAARLARGARLELPSDDVILVAGSLGPADVSELPANVLGFALAEGGVTAHAAIVARSLGLPMTVGLGSELLQVGEGARVLVDGTAGLAIVDPAPERLQARSGRRQFSAGGRGPSVTLDGYRVRVLANVSTAAEARLALAAGAEGAGLVRTELCFLEARRWPTSAEHLLQLRPVLQELGDRPATVRLLDFGADKTPPFLAGTGGRGVRLLLESPAALDAQLRALAATGGAGLRVLIPMVTEPEQIREVRERLSRLGSAAPVGAMIEVPVAAAMAPQLAAEADFFSIGTNDLTQFELGLDRLRPGQAATHHPAVLRLVDATVRASREAGIPVEVCGEAASDPAVMPLLVGLGVDELSVGAARVAQVKDWVRRLEHGRLEQLAQAAIRCGSAVEVEALVAPLRKLLDQAGDAEG